MSPRQSFTERRRRQLARQVDRLEQFESRNMITESLGLMVMGIGLCNWRPRLRPAGRRNGAR